MARPIQQMQVRYLHRNFIEEGVQLMSLTSRRTRSGLKPKPAFTVSVVVGVASLLLAACGSAGGQAASTGGSGASQTTSAGGSSSAPIVIGTTASETGVNSVAGLISLKGEQYGVAQLNKNGGLLGRKVVLKVYDDQSNPAMVAQLYTRLITQDKVNLILGPYAPALADAVAPIAARYHFLDIDPETATPPLGGSGWAIQAINGAGQYFKTLPKAALTSGLHTIAIVGLNNSFGVDCINSVKAQAVATGLNVVYSGEYDPTSTNFGSTAAAIKNAAPDVVVQCSFYVDAVDLTRALASVGYHPKMLAESVGPAVPTYSTSLGALANRVVYSTSWWPTLPTPGNASFVSGYKAMFGTEPDYHAATNYSAIEVLSALVKKVGSLDQTKLREAAYSMTIPTVQGEFRLDSSGQPQGFVSYLAQYQGGTQVLVWPPSVAQAPIQVPYGA